MDNPTNRHKNVAKPGADGSVGNSEPGMDGWTAATWADWRSIGRALAPIVAIWVIGYLIWRNWEWIATLI